MTAPHQSSLYRYLIPTFFFFLCCLLVYLPLITFLFLISFAIMVLCSQPEDIYTIEAITVPPDNLVNLTSRFDTLFIDGFSLSDLI